MAARIAAGDTRGNTVSDDRFDLPRRAPDPIPAIHPVPEYAVEGRRAEWYADMKSVFQVPWMGVVTMAYAHYPTFFEVLWRGTRELAASRPFVETFLGLRAFVEAEIVALDPPPIARRLVDHGYGAREIDSIREVNEVFSHGNFPYTVMSTIARLLVEGGEMTARGEVRPFEGRHAPDVRVPFLLMEAHHADEASRAVYEDVKAVLRLPFVNTDYRAFARWPSYWAMAWGDLRKVAGGEAHEAICQAYHDRVLGAVASELPNVGGITSAAVREAAATDAPLEEVVGMCRLFQWLLPGLVCNVAYLRAQLLAD